VWPEALDTLKKLIHLARFRTRDLPACSIVPRRTALPRGPLLLYYRTNVSPCLLLHFHFLLFYFAFYSSFNVPLLSSITSPSLSCIYFTSNSSKSYSFRFALRRCWGPPVDTNAASSLWNSDVGGIGRLHWLPPELAIRWRPDLTAGSNRNHCHCAHSYWALVQL
jgi:hypothetical protein